MGLLRDAAPFLFLAMVRRLMQKTYGWYKKLTQYDVAASWVATWEDEGRTLEESNAMDILSGFDRLGVDRSRDKFSALAPL